MKVVSESEESDVQVIEDEDLELAAQIEKERKEKRAQKLKEKREKAGKTPKKQAKKKATPKRRCVASSDEDDDDEDESPKKSPKKSKRHGKSSSETDSDDEKFSKRTKKDKKKKDKKRRKVESSESDESDDEEVRVKKSNKKTSLKMRKRTDSSESSEESEDSDSDAPKRSKRSQSRGKSASKSESDEEKSEEERAPKKKKRGRPPKKVSESAESDAPKRKSSSKKGRKESSEEDEDSENEKKRKMKKIKKSKKSKTRKFSVDYDDEVPKSRKNEKSKKRKHPKTSSEEDDEPESKSSESEKSDSDSEDVIISKSKKRNAVGRVSVEKSDESDPEVIPEPKKRIAVSSSEEEKNSDDDKKKIKKADEKKKKMESESESESDNNSSDGSIEMNRKSKRKSKKEPEKKKKGIIMDSADLAKETIDAEKAEKDRRKRLEKKQKEFNGIVLEEGEDLTELLTGTSSHRKLKSVVLDPDSSGDPKTPVEVHNSLVRILKPHQAHGIQFMYDCAFESLDRLDTEGSGGILAHCMGLGKTLQVITFLHTVMNHEKLGEKCKRVLVVVPKNVIINWFKEFQKWLIDNDEELDTIQVKELDSCKDVDDRRRALLRWHNSKTPSVMIIGYDMFRILTCEDDPKKKKTKLGRKLAKAKEDFRKYLQNPGPDLVVCDEAHKLKNDESALSKCMVKILTKRRLCLTGTPLQNNLMEYHCMVNFVKPGLLGTKNEFANRFVNIINRGRTKDASALEVSFMKRRCHVLYDHLKKCVDRKDYRVLTEAIPPKQEYVINVRLTERQCSLYTTFLNDVVGNTGLSKRLLPDYHMFSRIWTHPYQLIIHEQRLERERLLKEDAEEEADFIDDSASESEESVISYSSDSEASFVASSDDEGGSKKKNKKNKKEKKAPKAAKRRRGNDDEDGEDAAMNILQEGIRSSRRLAGEDADIRDTDTPPEYNGWFSSMVSDDDRDDYTLSNKLVLLMQIIKKCEEIGDKLLVFSQSLESLSLIKRMLEHMAGVGQWYADGHEALNQEGETWSWLEGEDYMVIDGSVQIGKRDSVQTQFNCPENLRARLMLISTRAGSLGTNMVAANRVVIFDACWNPSHDTQSLFRVYRFGQTKPVYIYRFIAQGTMEERIYKRQVTKESTSMRVVDEAQIQRHYLGHDLTELYQFTPSVFDPEVEIACAPPKDRLLADVIHQNPSAVVDYIEHDTLFANVEEEKLTEQEMREAWTDYEKDKSGLPPVRPQYDPNMLRGIGLGGPGGMIVGQNMQAMLQNRYNEAARFDQLQNDILFKELNKMRLKEVGTSLKIVLLRNLLEQILPYIPEEMRGGMSEFNTHFIRLVHETDRKMETPADLLRKSLESFKTVIKMVRAIPTCTEPLARMSRAYPYLFTE